MIVKQKMDINQAREKEIVLRMRMQVLDSGVLEKLREMIRKNGIPKKITHDNPIQETDTMTSNM